MSLSPILFLGLYALGLLATVGAGTQYGVYTYFLAFHMSPAGTWWENLVPDFRYLMIAAVVTLAAIFVRPDPQPNESWLGTPLFKILIAFNLWLWLMNAWAISPMHMEGCILFGKHLLITIVVYRVGKMDFRMVKNVCLALAIGCGWFGWLTLGKGGRVEGAAGAISDANTMGMHCAAGVMVASMMLLGLRGIYRWIPFFMIPLILNTVILAGSRGAFLGLVAGGLVAMYFCPKRLKGRFRLLGALGIVLFFMLAHEQFLERVTALYEGVFGEEQQLDGSASSRIELVKAGWRMALDYPMGVGHRGTAYLSPRYMDASLLTSGHNVGTRAARSAHNTFMAALVSYGFIGLLIFTALFIWAARELLRMRRHAEETEDMELGAVVSGIAAGLAVVLVAGQFSNYVYAEVQFWLLALLTAVMVQKSRLQSSEAGARAAPAGQWRRPGAMARSGQAEREVSR